VQEETGHVVVTAAVDADGKVVHGRDDHETGDRAWLSIPLPPPQEHLVLPAPLPPMRMAVEVV
jgi:hypothetical protein